MSSERRVAKKGVEGVLLALVLVCASCLAACGASSFHIEGKWKNVGDATWGQMQHGAIVSFNGWNCNVYSPYDTYALTKDGDSYRLDATSPFAQTVTLRVNVIDNDNIELKDGDTVVSLQRVG